MSENQIFAKRLKEIRLERNLTQKQLADSLNIIHQNINNWEKGVSFPNLITFVKLCHILKISSEYLLGQSDEPSEPKMLATWYF